MFCIALFCEAVLRRTILEEHGEAVLLHYGLDPRKTGKSHFTHRQWLNLGQQLLAGEARAVAAGFPAMAMPSIARVAADLAGADALLLAIAQEQLTLKDAQARRRGASRAAYRHLGDVAHHLRTALRHERPALIRGIIRTYGFVFTVTPSKAKAPAEEVVAAAPPQQLRARPERRQNPAEATAPLPRPQPPQAATPAPRPQPRRKRPRATRRSGQRRSGRRHAIQHGRAVNRAVSGPVSRSPG